MTRRADRPGPPEALCFSPFVLDAVEGRLLRLQLRYAHLHRAAGPVQLDVFEAVPQTHLDVSQRAIDAVTLGCVLPLRVGDEPLNASDDVGDAIRIKHR